MHVKLRKKHSRTVWEAAVNRVQSRDLSPKQANRDHGNLSVGRMWDTRDTSSPFPSSSFEGPAKLRRRGGGQRTESSEEEFFCLTPDDPKQSRSRNASSSSEMMQHKFHPMAPPPSASSHHPVADTKIFSVAVEASRLTSKIDSMKVCDLDTGFSGQFAVVSSKESPKESPQVSQASQDSEVKSKKSKKKKTSKEKKAAEVDLKAAKSRVIESPPKELLVDLDSDSPPLSSAAKVVRPEKTQRATSKSVKVRKISEGFTLVNRFNFILKLTCRLRWTTRRRRTTRRNRSS